MYTHKHADIPLASHECAHKHVHVQTHYMHRECTYTNMYVHMQTCHMHHVNIHTQARTHADIPHKIFYNISVMISIIHASLIMICSLLLFNFRFLKEMKIFFNYFATGFHRAQSGLELDM